MPDDAARDGFVVYIFTWVFLNDQMNEKNYFYYIFVKKNLQLFIHFLHFFSGDNADDDQPLKTPGETSTNLFLYSVSIYLWLYHNISIEGLLKE